MTEPRIGFVGLGIMGTPMALNLVRAGVPLRVWNRTAARTAPLVEAGAIAVDDIDELFAGSDVVLMMLADGPAVDEVLGRGSVKLANRLQGRVVVHMGTTSPQYSQSLAGEVRAAGGRYVEAPVSGSRVPAERGELVALVAGKPEDVALVRPLLQPMCRATLDCGDVSNGLLMKLAVNVFLITMITGLTETFHFARRLGLDETALATALNGGQMASDISRVKVAKLLDGDMSAQAAISDVLKNNRLVVDAARSAEVSTPLMDVCCALFSEAEQQGLGGQDMVAVLQAVAARDHRS